MIIYRAKSFSKKDYEGLNKKETKELKRFRNSLAKELKETRKHLNKEFKKNPTSDSLKYRNDEYSNLQERISGYAKDAGNTYKRMVRDSEEILSQNERYKKLPKVISKNGQGKIGKIALGTGIALGTAYSAKKLYDSKKGKRE